MFSGLMWVVATVFDSTGIQHFLSSLKVLLDISVAVGGHAVVRRLTPRNSKVRGLCWKLQEPDQELSWQEAQTARTAGKCWGSYSLPFLWGPKALLWAPHFPSAPSFSPDTSFFLCPAITSAWMGF